MEFVSPFGTQDMQNDVLVCVCSDHFPLVRNFDLEGVDQGPPFLEFASPIGNQDVQNHLQVCMFRPFSL